MNVPMSWLKEYVSIDCDINEYVHKMTMTGTKVEGVENLGEVLNNIVVGKITKIEQHPNADKLVITQVDVGAQGVLQIVTGATNIKEGDYVPVALDGSTVHGGVVIKKGRLRGEESNGMMCSIQELGYDTHDYPEAPEHGIYVFPKEQEAQLELGADVRPILQLCDEVVEYEITSNRPDCYSVLGIAREASATFSKPLNFPMPTLKETSEGNIKEMIDIEILNAELCPRYIARVVKNVKIEPSPLWLRHRLTAAGLRPINNIVDITNYVMLELGQPMHAFDIDNVSNKKIIVRNAKDGETFKTLDGVERNLDSSMLVIADCDKALAIAGVMGGENSKVTENATGILFESACFNGVNIRHTSKKLGLRTDASGKYEKGLDPNLALLAVERAVQLVEMLGCGEVVKGHVDCYPNVRNSYTINYNPQKINELLGTQICESDMEHYLESLGIKAKNGVAKIPTFRYDIEGEADIAEEVARLYGYDKIEATLTSGTPTIGKKSLTQQMEDMVKNYMLSVGFCEAMNYSFESPKVFDKLNVAKDSYLRHTVNIINPLGEDFSIMRTTTLNAMLNSLSTNFNRRNEEALLFEVAKVYLPKSLPLEALPNEPTMLTIAMYGKKDFYDLKGIVEGLFEMLGLNNVSYVPEEKLTYMHPGRTATIRLGGTELGMLGEVHPTVADNYSIGTKVYVATVCLDTIYANANLERKYVSLPKYPSVERDLALLLKDEVTNEQIISSVKENGGKLLTGVVPFDVYKGKQIQEGYKSMAYRISFRSDERTLTEDEVSKLMKRIMKSLEENLGAELRV